jgi:hypothetical protein
MTKKEIQYIIEEVAYILSGAIIFDIVFDIFKNKK